MVISAYYSKIPTITCEDCGETIEWQHEHTHICGEFESEDVPPVPGNYGRRFDDISRGVGQLGINNHYEHEDESLYKRNRADDRPRLQAESSDRSNLTRNNSQRGLERENSHRNVERSNSKRERERLRYRGPQCLNCRQPLLSEDDGFEIEALGGWFHADCFNCDVCKRPFDDEYPFVPHEGKAYCEVHYEELFLPSCAACQKPITDGKISNAFGRTFHARHLRCHICKHRIRGSHVEHNGKAFCQEDYEKLTNSDCLRCRNPIDGPSVAACGGVFHKECFSCTSCSKPFPNKKFYIFENRPYCLLHYHEVSNSLCGRCEEPIQGPCVDVEEVGYKFHPECWCCATCERLLTGVYYSYNGFAYCESDIDKVYQKKAGNKRSDRPTKRNTLLRQ